MKINSKCVGSVSVRGPYLSKRAEKVIKQLSSGSGVIIEYHVLRALEKQGFELDINRDNKSVYEPDKMFECLARYGEIPKLDNVDVKVWNEAWQATLEVFGGSGVLNVLSSKSDLLDSVKQEKASGAPLFEKKGEAFDRDYERMLRFARGECAAQPCVAYHRIQHGDFGPKTRLVWGYPLHMTLLEAKYARPLIEHFLNVRGVMAFGLHRHELAARLIPIENMGVRYCFDFSKFDSSIHPRLISKAFTVLRTHFIDLDEKEWERLIHYFIHTPILMPDGLVYQKHQGVPSGSYFTQLIDSIVNYFAQQYSALRLVSKLIETNKILVLGDDGVTGVNRYVPMVRWASAFRELGLTLNVDKSDVFRHGDPIVFLGHIWERGLANREIEDIAKRMAFPERTIQIEDARLRIVSRVLAYASDALNSHLIILRWSRYNGTEISSIYFRDVLNEPLTGWREMESGDRSTVSFPKSALAQSHIGILT